MTEEIDEIWEEIVKAMYCSVCDSTADMTNGECPKMNHEMSACPARRAASKMMRRRMRIRM